MSAVWTLPERHLMIELAVSLARRLEAILGGPDHVPPGHVHHGYASTFETGCDVLWRLGVARAAYGPEPGRSELTHPTIIHDKAWPPYFRLFPASEIRTVLSGDPLPSAPSLHEMLCAYLEVACEYGRDGARLPSTRDPFTPQPDCVADIEALERMGYIARQDAAVRWTDKIAPAMQRAGLWRADGQSVQAVAAAALKDEVAGALGATPEHTRRLLVAEARRASELEFAYVLRDRFAGLYWTTNPDGTLRPQSGDLGLAKAVYRCLRQRDP